jgi:hypothetical protein
MKRIYLKIIVIGALLSMACTTKVSEWVLLNAAPENYVLTYFHKGKLTESEELQSQQLENKLERANVLFKSEEKDEIVKPYYALYFNNHLISEYSQYNELEQIASSPLRKKIASDLTEGKLCVLLYLKSGNQEKDETGLETINKTIEASPFKNVITVQELDRKNMDESIFVSMLLNIEDDLKDIHEPMLFGIYGRFRALEPLLAKGISEENINLMIDFFTADCSCLIKDNLPGRSILFNGHWENPQPALVNTILDANPELMHQ